MSNKSPSPEMTPVSLSRDGKGKKLIVFRIAAGSDVFSHDDRLGNPGIPLDVINRAILRNILAEFLAAQHGEKFRNRLLGNERNAVSG